MPKDVTDFIVITLDKDSEEYNDVYKRFHATVAGVTITKIERIQNPLLYQTYMVRKQKMHKDISGDSERRLFHGTSAKNVPSINTNGFNRSLCGVNGKFITSDCRMVLMFGLANVNPDIYANSKHPFHSF